jgi:hypothetical protein
MSRSKIKLEGEKKAKTKGAMEAHNYIFSLYPY